MFFRANSRKTNRMTVPKAKAVPFSRTTRPMAYCRKAISVSALKEGSGNEVIMLSGLKIMERNGAIIVMEKMEKSTETRFNRAMADSRSG